MPSTASATTTTASNFKPFTNPPNQTVSVTVPPADASRNSSRNDGNVNPRNTATPPQAPARWYPMAKPTWLEDGPGRNWLRAMSRP